MTETWLLAKGVQTRMNNTEFEAGLKSGCFAPRDLYWREGMVAWLPVPMTFEPESTKDPEALLASLNIWTRWVRRVFFAAAVFGVLAMPPLAWIKTHGFGDSDSIFVLLLALSAVLVLIPFFAAGVAVYIIPAIWLYRLCSAAEFCERPQIPPQFVAIAWCVPIANMIIPVLGLISVARAAGTVFPKVAWIGIGATVVGLSFQVAGTIGAASANRSFMLSLFFSLWLLCDAARYLTWRKIAGDFSRQIELRINKCMTKPDFSARDSD